MSKDMVGPKLVLYSDQLIPETEGIDRRLMVLLGKEQIRIGYIASVSDPTRKYYQARQAYYARYRIDLTPYFELDKTYHPEDLSDLLTADAIHLSGGQTFSFLHWLRVRNLLDVLRQYAVSGGILIGVSAGAILMTQDIRTTLLCGEALPSEKTETSGLGLVDFAFVPHVGRYAALADIQTYSQQNNRLVYACPDNAGIIVENNHVECLGGVMMIKNGVVTNL